MTSRQIELVQSTFEQVEPAAEAVAETFYKKLFETDPSLRGLFRGDMVQQGRLLMQMLTVAVGSLRKLDSIIPVVEQLGKRHTGYGVRDEHYATVGASLLWTLEQGLGAAFTAEVKDAWGAVYTTLTDVMRRGAAHAASAA